MSRLFSKYTITKNDGSPVDPNAQYFVLRIDTDPVARKAALRYSSYISQTDPEFAEEIFKWVMQYESGRTTGAGDVLRCGHSEGIEFGESSWSCVVCGQPARP